MGSLNKTFINTTIVNSYQGTQFVELYDKAEIQLNLTDSTPDDANFSGAATNTTTDAITVLDHGLISGAVIRFSTTGTLPDGLAVSTDFYAIRESANTFQVATSYSNAIAGTYIELIDEGTGTHTLEPTALSGVTVYVQKSLDNVNWVTVIEPRIVSAPISTIFSLEDMVTPYISVNIEVDSGQVSAESIIYMKNFIN